MALPLSPLRLGTRASPLALAQAYSVRDALISAHALTLAAVEIVPIVASGDKITDRALADVGGKALWTKELDQALAGGRIDLAVHSMKDVETLRPPHFRIAAMLARADVRDRLIGCPRIVALKLGGIIGSSSPRRRAQLLRLRPDLRMVLFRGNVATRLAKLDAGEVDATLLAAAGLDRLGMTTTGTPIPLETMLPAPAQGAIGIEIRANDARMSDLVGAINDPVTFNCVTTERALLAALGGSCHSPIAALATIEGTMLRLRAEIYSPDGTEMVRKSATFARDDAEAISALATELIRMASPSLSALFSP